uniref:Uncharacterized protein n=1 Tax=Anguilla anguilla TaxID=7936 RepID=A0A0E9R3F1_ANGAN
MLAGRALYFFNQTENKHSSLNKPLLSQQNH